MVFVGRKVTMSSGKRWSAVKISPPSVTVTCGELSKFELKENCGNEGQMGESQSHHGLWSVSCLKECSNVSKLESQTSPKRIVAANGDYSCSDKRGNLEMPDTQKCECCHASHFNAASCLGWKHRVAG